MVSARFTSFLLIFILLPLRFSSGLTQHQQVKKRMMVATGSKLETVRSSVNVEEKIYDGVPESETDQRTRFILLGRKMMSTGVLSKSKVQVKSEDGVIAKGSTAKGKAKCNHEEGKGILNVKHKFSKRSRHYANVKTSGFIPLNADYHVPGPHPPRNN